MTIFSVYAPRRIERWRHILQLKSPILVYALIAVGISGVIISLVTEQSDYDPVAFGIATVSIIVAIVGIALAFKLPTENGPKLVPEPL